MEKGDGRRETGEWRRDDAVPRPVHILLIEDNRECAELTAHLILQALPGAEMTTYTTLREAAADLAQHAPGHYALIILDLNLADGAWGLAALPRLYAVPATPPILILSGHLGPTTATEALRLGVRTCLLKDASSEVIIQGIKELTNGAL